MSEPNHNIVNLIIIGTIFFLLLGSSLVLLVNLFSKTRRSYYLEKQNMQQQFQHEILQSRLEIQEATFNNISQEIHDNVGQLLSLAKVQLNILEQTEPVDKTMLQDVKESLGKAMADLRDIAKSLSGERMQQMGLVQTLQHEIERINRSTIIQASLYIHGEPYKLNEQKQLIIFRIVQEAMQNVIKHAFAEKLEVVLTYFPAKLELNINDNGKGFEDEENKPATGLGLQNIVSRAALIGGEAVISSRPNEGTTIKLTVPYE